MKFYRTNNKRIKTKLEIEITEIIKLLSSVKSSTSIGVIHRNAFQQL